MDIIVRRALNSINSFELNGLPDLVVLTGENGTGKTQLLEYLFASSSFNNDGALAFEHANLANEAFLTSCTPEVQIDPETGVETQVFPAEIRDNDERLIHLVYRPVETPYIDVGDSFDLERIKQEGERLAQKHLFIDSNPHLKDCTQLSNAFIKTLGVVKPSGGFVREMRIPEITMQDLEMIKRIEKSFPKDYSKDYLYYISLYSLPQGGVFSANLRFLFYQYWAREQAGLNPGTKPWAQFNEIGNDLGFKFEIDEPRLSEKRFDVRLRDKKKGCFVSPNYLSSGEKVIFSLFLALHSTQSLVSKPNVILLDEPDAFLHPSLSSTMLHVLNDIFVNKYRVKIILTTHSPSTVALSPENSIFIMDPDSGVMKKASKKQAILSLTSGLNTLSVYYENNKQIFVEAKNDVYVLNHIFHIAKQMNWLKSNEIQLHFINVGDEATEGGCSKVQDIVSSLRDAGNQTVFGLIDWDEKNSAKDNIFVLGDQRRYAIDNYILDPVSISLLFLDEEKEKTKIGFLEEDNIVGFAKKSRVEIQSIVDKIIAQLALNIPGSLLTKADLVDYSLANGQVYRVPRWFFETRGHDMVGYYKTTFPFLNKYKKECDLYKRIVSLAYGNYPGIIPMDLIDTLIDLQSA